MLRERAQAAAATADERRPCHAEDDERAVWVEVPDEPTADAEQLRGWCQACFDDHLYKLEPPVPRRLRNVITGEVVDVEERTA
jgi:hypothetical protein